MLTIACLNSLMKMLLYNDSQTDIAILNLVISHNLRLARFISTLCHSYIPHEIQLTRKVFAGADVFYREHTLAHPIYCSETCGSAEAITLNTIFKKCGVGCSEGGQDSFILRTR